MEKRRHLGLSWILLLLFAGLSHGLEVHFEQKDGGFFIRPSSLLSGGGHGPITGFTPSLSMSSRSSSSSSVEQQAPDSSDWEIDPSDPSTLTTEHFTVLPSSQPVAIRVTYGPFSTKQTVPIRLLVPDPLDELLPNGTMSTDPDMIPPLDLSAHLVTPTVPKDTPILRVLFHAGQTAFGLPMSVIPAQNGQRGPRQQQGPGSGTRRHRTRLCLLAQAQKSQGDVVTSSCSPDARDSTCLAELTLPIHWWPEGALPISEDQAGPLKPTKIPIQVSYTVYEPENGHCNEIGLSTTYGAGIVGEGSGTRRIQIQPPTPLATAILVNAQKAYRVVKADASDAVKLLVPQGALFPHAKFYIPVTVGKHDHHSIVAFIMRARVKSGLRIIGIEPNADKMWNITTDFNPRRTHATITAVRKFDPRFQDTKGEDEEVFNWILEAAEEAGDDWDGGRVVWILRYVIQPSADSSWMNKDPFANFGDERHKLTTRLEIQKDDIQAVLPIAKSWEVVNTAVLDGKQVSRPMKVFIVSRAGQVADVTLQASCRSLDESVLKVSSSCTSVYVDGSEIRGSTNATIVIKYGTYEGSAQFIVWMPEFQLNIQLSDPKLNQIKGWRVPNGLSSQGKRDTKGDEMMMGDSPLKPYSDDYDKVSVYRSSSRSAASSTTLGSSTQGLGEDDDDGETSQGGGEAMDRVLSSSASRQDYQEPLEEDNETDAEEEEDTEDKFQCRLRYQHSRIDVFARFLASDHDSGRTSYFISKKTYLKVTDLISDYLRVVDTQVASIKGATPYIQGLSPGRTEVQVVSPVTGRVLGAKEIRVLNEKVSITSMKIQVISGVQLSLFPDTDSDNEFIAETTITSKLSAKYQEALLDIKLRFSDNTWIKLDEVDRENYVLAVDSLEPTVVELPPIQNSKYPRILAVSEGGGPIMRVSLELSDQCHRQNSQPLAMSVAQVEVNFTTSTSRSEFTQNDSNQGLGTAKHSFRKTGRGGKERGLNGNFKKDLTAFSHGSSGHVNDMTGIPLKDDSSRASRPAQRMDAIPLGFGPDKGWTFSPRNTPLEIAMYVLLGVFSVAILVFVASCVVYASRVKKRELSPPDGRGLEIKFEHSTLGGRGMGGTGTAATTNAHDWVWLGRASLALHPSLDSSKHSSQNSSKSVSFESGGGTNPIRIINNPNFESTRAGGNGSVHSASSTPATQGGLPGSSRPFMRTEPLKLSPPPPRPPKPQSQRPSESPKTPPIDSNTFSVKGGKSPTPAGSSFPPPDYRPPVPPHRNFSPLQSTSPAPSSSGTGGSTKSNSNNNYGRHIPGSKINNNGGRVDPDDLPNPSSMEFEFDRLADSDAKRGNIVGNPMCFIDEEEEDYDDDDDLRLTQPLTMAAGAAARQNHRVKNQTTDSVKLNMDYDQLMEYFDSLKETEA